MKIINSVVVVGLYYGFLTTFSIGPLISSFSELGLWKKEKKEPRRKYQQQPVLLRDSS
ncbi:unnamed protein product [Malus baccata var. baccata]